MPAPMISIQPVPLTRAAAAAAHSMQLTSTSALGSVNGKYDGRKRTRALLPNRPRANSASVPLRSTKVTSSSTASPRADRTRARVMHRTDRAGRPCRRDDADRRLMLLHRADLYGRGVAAQQDAGCDVEGVVHVGRRMIERRVQRDEVVPVGFRLGPTRARETETF